MPESRDHLDGDAGHARCGKHANSPYFGEDAGERTGRHDQREGGTDEAAVRHAVDCAGGHLMSTDGGINDDRPLWVSVVGGAVGVGGPVAIMLADVARNHISGAVAAVIGIFAFPVSTNCFMSPDGSLHPALAEAG